MNGGTIEKPVHDEITYADIHQTQDNLWNFLFFTGYLKKVGERKDAAGENRFKRLDLAKGSIRNKVLAAINTDELDHIFDTDGVFED